ncbi:MAG: hypothetical protein HPY54_02465 [Chthonomonadetes bacterium]|nr:hypothetical protein [Chthonomonadetes bacterium]
MNASWWGRLWLRALTWAFYSEPPQVHGGNLAILPPRAVAFPLRQEVPIVRRPRPVCCRVRGVSAEANRCAMRVIARPKTRVRTVCAPSTAVRQHRISLAIGARPHKLVPIRATLAASHRVLISSTQPAVHARVRLLPNRVGTCAVQLRWRCLAQPLAVERFRCGNVSSSLVWRLPLSRRAVSFRQLNAEWRRRCVEALERAAKGYARVQSVYYPVPAHTVMRLEIDETLGVLYVYPRRGRNDMPPGCLWVVCGTRVMDGQPVRAVLRVS